MQQQASCQPATRRSIRLAAIFFLVLLPTIGGVCVVSAQPPPHLVIIAATIEELPPIDVSDVANRQVVLRIDLAAAPRCAPGGDAAVYGFLIDADNDPATGAADAAFAKLGIDARISARCDPPTGTFLSPVGPVTIAVDLATGSARLEISTIVARLPSLLFQWIAFAHEGTVFTRLPEDPDSPAAWAILELVEH
jgi:hypothetical protein